MTSRDRTRCVPMRTSTVPVRKSASTFLTSAGGRNRETVSTRTGRSRKRSRNVPPCCWARTVVGASTSTWRPPVTALSAPPQRDLGLAEADVAADQPVHRALLLHVLGDGVDRTLLVVGLLEGEAGLQPGHHLVVAGERRPGRCSACVRTARAAPRPARARRCGRGCAASATPCRPAGTGWERRPRADVAADLAELLVWDVEAVVAAELQVQVIADHPAHLTGVEADEAADPVVVVDDVVAGRRSPNAASARPIGSGARDVRRRNSWAELSTASRSAG